MSAVVNGRGSGPTTARVVAVGGGHGLANTLRAARRYAAAVTAVVSVADDGGSSGRLRQALGTVAPGDLRKCLVALGREDTVWARAFEHRFAGGELDGHALGNLVITGLIESTGDLIEALDEAGRLLATDGRVLPATLGPVVLYADTAGGAVQGQVAVSAASHIAHVSIVPPDAGVPEAVVKAIAAADQVVLGPGSLFTSVLAAAVVPGIRDAIEGSSALKVYVCNLRPQLPETGGYDVAAHVAALGRHGVVVDVVLCDTDHMELGTCAARVVSRDLAAAGGRAHDPVRLAAALADLVG